ncbi:hypothetical protein GCT13_06020 [Paraburkholderia sp. CNPSo 3157]|uniref:Uncharacterized protein n=1 Tax=Paraburkholderia franconis TaxID=2654983 RepID=A0A7X1TEV6_9BURK|nr:hypothetical protein [Paraburkholderia franconis]MPW16499.1 hypothetical protein [Paraburkholderia franconis]
MTVIHIALPAWRMQTMPLPDALQGHADDRSTDQPTARQTRNQRFAGYAEIVTIHAQPFQDCAVPHSYHECHENPERNRFAHGR